MYNFAMLAGPATGGAVGNGGAPVCFLTSDTLLEEQLVALPLKLLNAEIVLFTFGIVIFHNFFLYCVSTAASQ